MPKYLLRSGMDFPCRSTTSRSSRRGHRRGRDDVPRNPLGARSPGDSRASRTFVLRPTRARRPTPASPRSGSSPGSASSASRRSRRSPGRPPTCLLQKRQDECRQDGQGDTRPRHLPRMGPLPQVEGIRDLAGAYDGFTARLVHVPSSGCSPSSQSGVFSSTAAPRPPATRWKTDLTTSEVARRQGQAAG